VGLKIKDLDWPLALVSFLSHSHQAPIQRSGNEKENKRQRDLIFICATRKPFFGEVETGG
jgi:hypothetical protein|tara:strand:+ start:418 stop:597 length:180 start_codon:yes stop_codon:yes gene_type:complete